MMGRRRPLSFIANIVQHQSLTLVKPNADVPVLPLNTIAIDGKTWSFGLRDFERLDVRSQVLARSDRRRVGRQSDRAKVINPNDLRGGADRQPDAGLQSDDHIDCPLHRY